MGTIDRVTYSSFEQRRSALALAAEMAMKTYADADIRAAWNEGRIEPPILALHNTTKESIIKGASIALGAENLAELQIQSRLFAEKQKPSSAISEEDKARKKMIAQYKAELLSLSNQLPIVDSVSELIGEDSLTPSRREIGVAIANFALVSSRSETETLSADRMVGIRELTVRAIDAVLTNSKPDWIRTTEPPQAGPRRQRPTATTAVPPKRERPSLGKLPGSGFKF